MEIGVLLDNEFTIDIRVKNEAFYLKSIGYNVNILCPNFGGKALFEEFNGIKIYRFSLKKSLKNKLFGLMNILPFYEKLWIKKVKKFVDQVNPQILHAHDLYMAKIANLGGSRKIPVVLDLHENFPAAILAYRWSSKFPYSLLSRPKSWERKELKYLGYANRIVVLSNSFKNSLIKKYPSLPSSKFYVYPNVPDVKELLSFSINKNILPKTDKFILFYFGGISKRRGIITCFDAIRILQPEIPSIHLLLIGPVDGHEKTLFEKYLDDPFLKEHVMHYKWKDLSEFPSYTMISDICLSPIFKNEQHDSGVANKVFQYMLFEKPIIVSNCTPQVEIVEQEKCGLAFLSNDAIDLAKQIKFLYLNPEIREVMGQNGKKAVLEKYNLEKCGEQLKDLYTSLQNESI